MIDFGDGEDVLSQLKNKMIEMGYTFSPAEEKVWDDYFKVE